MYSTSAITAQIDATRRGCQYYVPIYVLILSTVFFVERDSTGNDEHSIRSWKVRQAQDVRKNVSAIVQGTRAIEEAPGGRVQRTCHADLD